MSALQISSAFSGWVEDSFGEAMMLLNLDCSESGLAAGGFVVADLTGLDATAASSGPIFDA